MGRKCNLDMAPKFLSGVLVDMYAKMGLVSDAKKVFDWVQDWSMIMYNTMIAGLLRCGMVEDSKRLFHDMKERVSISLTMMITRLVSNGMEAEAIDLFRYTTLEGMTVNYQEDSNQLFNEMNFRDEVSWTAFISGYA
ncbi:hypothetical protein SADUNF_Sadunf08G0091600 [Salix dunnii]|uniref:Pentatricopeptide repeat-containing protein n=1 Tax=Salix dunnii TaxID=1413687 RepID=A0A835JTL4_9ROSI|nr:hypothetical protein SADUNF_Sadunf08G0091600 [Salix dunnii]